MPHLISQFSHFSRPPPEEGVAEALGRAGPALAGREAAARGAATNIALATECNRRRQFPASSSPTLCLGELDALPPPPPLPPRRDGREGAVKRRRAPRRAEMKDIFLSVRRKREVERQSLKYLDGKKTSTSSLLLLQARRRGRVEPVNRPALHAGHRVEHHVDDARPRVFVVSVFFAAKSRFP